MPQSARDLRIQRLKSLIDQRVPFEKTGYRMLLVEATCEESFAKLRKADAFLFAPESEIWRINRERCGLIYGPAAAVLQVSHPRVAQGVHDHSKFRTDTIGRLHRTIERYEPDRLRHDLRGGSHENAVGGGAPEGSRCRIRRC